MSGLDSMASLSQAMEEESQRRLQTDELWLTLEQYRTAMLGAERDADRLQETQDVLTRVGHRLLFLSVDYAHQRGDEAKCKAADAALLAAFGTSAGPQLVLVGRVYSRLQLSPVPELTTVLDFKDGFRKVSFATAAVLMYNCSTCR